MAQVDLFVILDDCCFTKSGVTHRVRIRTAQGSSWLTVPVGKREVPIIALSPDSAQDWGTRHWNVIQSAYAKSAFWSEFAPWLKRLLKTKWEKLVDLNLQSIRDVASLLGIATPLVQTSALPESLRATLGSGSERNLEICRYLGARTYVSGYGARDYNDEQAFAAAGVKLEYIAFQQPVYPQAGEGFVPGLSVIDLLLNCGPGSKHILLG